MTAFHSRFLRRFTLLLLPLSVVTIGLICYLLFEETSDVSNDEIERTVLQLLHKASSAADDIRRNRSGKIVYFTKTYTDYDAPKAPASWCSKLQNDSPEYFWIATTNRRKVEKLSSLEWDRLLTGCFPHHRVDRRAYRKVVRSLRLLRDAFASASIPLFAVFGSDLGSIRYHRRMPFDTDYDLAYMESDASKVEALLMKLVSEPSNEMRAFGSTLSWSNTKVGLACGRSTWWTYQLPWKILYGQQATFNGSWLQMHTYHPVNCALRPCASYLDFYNISHTNDSGLLRIQSSKATIHLSDINDTTPEYRPLEGTLFRVPHNSGKFLRRHYETETEFCVPKERIEIPKWWMFNQEKFTCDALTIPCRLLDRIYPRVHRFASTEAPGSFETGLIYDRLGNCLIKSVFYDGL